MSTTFSLRKIIASESKKNNNYTKSIIWFTCKSYQILADIPIDWQFKIKHEDQIDLLKGICLLSIVMHGKKQFVLCNKHFLKLYKSLHIIRKKTSNNLCLGQIILESPSSCLTLLEFVRSN